MSQQNLHRVEYTGEVSPGNELLVTDDDHVVVETGETEPPIVSSRAIARIAVTGYIAEGHREQGFWGLWRDLRANIEIKVQLTGSSGIGSVLRVLADPNEQDATANNKLVRTKPGHRYFLVAPPEEDK
jgi:hypothetical protein